MIGGGGNRTNLTNSKKDLNHIKSHMMSWGRQKMLGDGDDHENLDLKEKKGVVKSGWHQNKKRERERVAEINKREVNIFQVWYGSLCKIKIFLKLINFLFICLYLALLQKGFMATYQNIRLESYCIGP